MLKNINKGRFEYIFKNWDNKFWGFHNNSIINNKEQCPSRTFTAIAAKTLSPFSFNTRFLRKFGQVNDLKVKMFILKFKLWRFSQILQLKFRNLRNIIYIHRCQQKFSNIRIIINLRNFVFIFEFYVFHNQTLSKGWQTCRFHIKDCNPNFFHQQILIYRFFNTDFLHCWLLTWQTINVLFFQKNFKIKISHNFALVEKRC